MRIKSFGCSFIFGNDLHDDGRDKPYATPSQHTWPALIARRLGCKYLCRARGGSGNLQIMDRVFNEAAGAGIDQDLYIISWSWIDRFDYGHGVLDHLSGTWQTLQPIHDDDVAKNYYKHLHSEYRDKLTSLSYIRNVIDLLNQSRTPFVMTYLDELLFDQRWHVSPAISHLQNYIQPYMTKFESKTFLDWSRDGGFEISPTLHPLEPAHAAAADIVWPRVQELVKNYNLV